MGALIAHADEIEDVIDKEAVVQVSDDDDDDDGVVKRETVAKANWGGGAP